MPKTNEYVKRERDGYSGTVHIPHDLWIAVETIAKYTNRTRKSIVLESVQHEVDAVFAKLFKEEA